MTETRGMGGATPLLSAQDITVCYGQVEAVRKVSISVQPGQIVSVIGANGAGKSTLLAALVGVLPLSSGQVVYQGQELHAPTEVRVAQGISLVPERRELFGSMTVEDNLRLGAYTQRATLADGLADVYRRFPKLRERRQQATGTLSGGEQQMVAIGRALMARPRLLLLDEPSLGLAPLIVREILEIVRELRTSGVTILLVEQNARAALSMSDYGYVLESGELITEGPAQALANDRAVVESFLGASVGPA